MPWAKNTQGLTPLPCFGDICKEVSGENVGLCATFELFSSAMLSFEYNRGTRLLTLALDSSDVVDEFEKWQELSPNPDDAELLIYSDIFLFCDSPTVVSVTLLVTVSQDGGEEDCIETVAEHFRQYLLIRQRYACCYDMKRKRTIRKASLRIPFFTFTTEILYLLHSWVLQHTTTVSENQ